MPQDKTRSFEAAIEIDRGDQRFVNVGQQIRRHPVVAGHALAEKQEVAEVEFLAEAGAGATADDRRFDFRQVAFLVVGKAQIELLAGDKPENRVAEKLHAFVGGEARVGAGRVRQGARRSSGWRNW